MCAVQAGSAPRITRNRLDLWTTELATKGVAHEMWSLNKDVFNTAESSALTWERALSQFAISSNPGVICRNDVTYHDIFAYRDQRLKYVTYNDTSDSWSSEVDLGGKLAGSPVVHQVNNNRMDFFGIGEDKQMYWSSWTRSASQFGQLQSLQGSFVSTPTVVSQQLSGKDVLLIFALGVGLSKAGFEGSWLTKCTTTVRL